jgi:hypothetical protein
MRNLLDLDFGALAKLITKGSQNCVTSMACMAGYLQELHICPQVLRPLQETNDFGQD